MITFGYLFSFVAAVDVDFPLVKNVVVKIHTVNLFLSALHLEREGSRLKGIPREPSILVAAKPWTPSYISFFSNFLQNHPPTVVMSKLTGFKSRKQLGADITVPTKWHNYCPLKYVVNE